MEIAVTKSTLTAVQARDALCDPARRASARDAASLQDLGLPGIYAWFVDEAGAAEIAAGLGAPLEEGLIYAGQAGAGTSSATLGSRIRRNHLSGDTYGSTFRFTLASALLRPLSLETLGGRRMTRDGEDRLSTWMRAHLSVSVIGSQDRDGLDAFETSVLELLDPPLNLAKRPATAARQRLTELRRTFNGAPTRREGPTMTTNRPGRETPRGGGLTPEVLARELGLPNAKSVRAFLRREFPRPAGELWSRWGALSGEMESAVRSRFGRRG